MIVSSTYMSFLVRLWYEPGQKVPAPPIEWYSEIECIQTGRRWTFTTLDEVLEFLRQQVKAIEAQSPSAGA